MSSFIVADKGKASHVTFDDVHKLADGNWISILTQIGIPGYLFDFPRQFPCPKNCLDPRDPHKQPGGRNRFHTFADTNERGGIRCRCCKPKGSDGFAAVMWWCNCDAGEALRKVAEIVGVGGVAGSLPTTTKPAPPSLGNDRSRLLGPVTDFVQDSPEIAKARDAYHALLKRACGDFERMPLIAGEPVATTATTQPNGEAFSSPEAVVARKKPPSFTIGGRWAYKDAAGQLVAYEYRFNPPDGSSQSKRFLPVSSWVDGWRACKPEGKWSLYRLPEVSGHDVVYLFEGAKCADAAVERMGLPATASQGGADGWRNTDWSPLAGKFVVISPDNDEPGRRYLEAVTSVLTALDPPATVKPIVLPVPHKGDVVDWIADTFGDVAEPDDVRGEFLKFVSSKANKKGSVMISTFTERAEPIIEGLFRRGEVANVIAAPKVGKSWLTMNMACRLAQGKPFLDYGVPRKTRVLVADNELYGSEIAYRLKLVKEATQLSDSDLDNIVYKRLRGTGRRDIYTIKNELIAEARFEQYDVMILDAFYKFLPPGVSENDNAQMADIYNTLDDIARRGDCAIVLVHHSSKGDQSEKAITDVGAGAGSMSRAADCHIVLRPHEFGGFLVMDVAARSWQTNRSLSIKKELPLFIPRPTIEAVTQSPKKAKQRRDDQSSFKQIAEAMEEGEQYRIGELAGMVDKSKDQLRRLLPLMVREGHVAEVEGEYCGKQCTHYQLSHPVD